MQFSGYLNCYLPFSSLTKTIFYWWLAFNLTNGYFCFPIRNTFNSLSNHSRMDFLNNNENIFLFRFFKYFDQVHNKLSNSCQQSYNYFRKHSSEKWALKSKSCLNHISLLILFPSDRCKFGY